MRHGQGFLFKKPILSVVLAGHNLDHEALRNSNSISITASITSVEVLGHADKQTGRSKPVCQSQHQPLLCQKPAPNSRLQSMGESCMCLSMVDVSGTPIMQQNRIVHCLHNVIVRGILDARKSAQPDQGIAHRPISELGQQPAFPCCLQALSCQARL